MEVSVLRRTLMEATLVLCKLRDTASIREALLKLMFSITPADRAAVLIDNCLWERDRGDPDQRVGVRSSIVDQVFKDGSRIFSDDHSIICVPLEAFDNRRGAIYAEASDSDARLDDGHLVLLTGVAAIAAVAFEHACFVEQLQAENSRLHEDLDLRLDLVGDSPAIADPSQFWRGTSSSGIEGKSAFGPGDFSGG